MSTDHHLSEMPSGDSTGGAASAGLHARATNRWLEVSGDVLSSLMQVSRRSLPVVISVAEDGATTHLSEQVIVTKLRGALDEAMGDAAAARIHVQADRSNRLQHITVELLAQYGSSLLQIAERAGEIIRQRLNLWAADGRPPTLEVVSAHIHFGDVVVGSPHLHSPGDGLAEAEEPEEAD
ncbi:hypothetical protein BH18ACT9_BH18ACT9_00230 [soil metagenome]